MTQQRRYSKRLLISLGLILALFSTESAKAMSFKEVGYNAACFVGHYVGKTPFVGTKIVKAWNNGSFYQKVAIGVACGLATLLLLGGVVYGLRKLYLATKAVYTEKWGASTEEFKLENETSKIKKFTHSNFVRFFYCLGRTGAHPFVKGYGYISSKIKSTGNKS